MSSVNLTALESLSPNATAYSAAIQARTQKSRVERSELVATFNQTLPWARTSARALSMLASILDELASADIIVLPKDKRHWDPGRPPLPKWIKLPAAPKSPKHRPHVAWRPELAWAATASLSSSQIEPLQAVNQWFRDISAHPDDQQVIPMRERSHQIFDDEKQLEKLLPTSLFAPGRLSLAQLHAVREPVPLAYSHIGPGNTLLVAENSDTYATLRTLLGPDPGPISYVAFGAGRAFESSIATACEMKDLTRIVYFGDVDADGLAIPTRASAVALQLGLPPVEPATALYTMLLNRRPTKGSLIDSHRAEQLVQWLPENLQHQTDTHLQRGHRWAQESLSRNDLRAQTSWMKALQEPHQ